MKQDLRQRAWHPELREKRPGEFFLRERFTFGEEPCQKRPWVPFNDAIPKETV
jgi:hypothetical protein